jgi:nucleotide-binding universal stress UspA family protein
MRRGKIKALLDGRYVVINLKKILYPTDFSSYSNQAYFHAIALAESHGASLTIVYVYAPTQGSPGGSTGGDASYWRRQLEQIRPTNRAIPVEHVFLQGDPADEIVSYAAKAGTDVIVMGTHGRTGLERLLLGSVAEKVMREALCSVLVVKLPRGQRTGDKAELAAAGSA